MRYLLHSTKQTNNSKHNFFYIKVFSEKVITRVLWKALQYSYVLLWNVCEVCLTAENLFVVRHWHDFTSYIILQGL